MDDMYNQHETPTGDAGATVGHYLTGTLAAADASVRLLTWLRRRQNPQEQELTPAHLEPSDLEQAGKLLDPKRQAYDAMLGPDAGRSADSRTALMAWVSAQPHRDGDTQAELVASRAEARLRELHPDAIGRYDALRAGLSPVEAMREVAPLIAAEQERESAHQVYGPMLDPATATTSGRELQPGVAAAAGQAPEVRYAPLVRDVLNAQLATDVLRDEARPALAGALQHAEQFGAQPADLLRHVASQRELDSAKHVAEVLHHRLEHHLVEQRTPTAADVAASSYPTPLTAAAAPAGTTTADPFAAGSGEHLQLDKRRLAGPDSATLGAAAELGRAADAQRHAAQTSAATAEDPSTPHIDERREGPSDAAVHTHRAAADQSTATAPLARADSRPTAAGGPASAPETAGPSYPTPIKDVSAAHAAPKPTTTAAPGARTAVKAAPTTAHRR